MPQLMIRCAQRRCAAAFARTSLVLFVLAVFAAELSAAMPASVRRAPALDPASSITNAPAENPAALRKESTPGSPVLKGSLISAQRVFDAGHYVAKWDSPRL